MAIERIRTIAAAALSTMTGPPSGVAQRETYDALRAAITYLRDGTIAPPWNGFAEYARVLTQLGDRQPVAWVAKARLAELIAELIAELHTHLPAPTGPDWAKIAAAGDAADAERADADSAAREAAAAQQRRIAALVAAAYGTLPDRVQRARRDGGDTVILLGPWSTTGGRDDADAYEAAARQLELDMRQARVQTRRGGGQPASGFGAETELYADVGDLLNIARRRVALAATPGQNVDLAGQGGLGEAPGAAASYTPPVPIGKRENFAARARDLLELVGDRPATDEHVQTARTRVSALLREFADGDLRSGVYAAAWLRRGDELQRAVERAALPTDIGQRVVGFARDVEVVAQAIVDAAR